MRQISLSLFAILVFSVTGFSQKGVDTQTKKITEKTGTNDNTNVTWGTTFGKDKTKVRERLANPYKLASRRDILVNTILNVLEEKKLIVDETSSKVKEGTIITVPFVFAKGSVITKNELNRYAIIPGSRSVWRGGRYSLRIDVESIDGIQNNVSVMAKVEGKAENGLVSEWTTLTSNGEAEEEFLVKLIEAVTGKNVNEPSEQ